MGNLINIWREVSAYLRYANTRNFALVAIIASALTLLTALRTTNSVSCVLVPSSFTFAVVSSLLTLAEIVLALSFIPRLDSLGNFESNWVIAAKMGYLIPRPSVSEHRNPIYFYDIGCFNNGVEYFEFLNSRFPDLIDSSSPTSSICAQQIWIIARISMKKFAQFAIALSFLFLGGAFYLIGCLIRAGQPCTTS